MGLRPNVRIAQTRPDAEATDTSYRGDRQDPVTWRGSARPVVSDWEFATVTERSVHLWDLKGTLEPSLRLPSIS